MKVRLDETLFKARAQENLSITNDINKLEQVDALVECLDHFVADRKWVDEISRDELLTMVTQSNGDKEVLIESVLAKFNTPCIDTKKLKECKERRQNNRVTESMKKRKSLKESDNRDTFTLDTSNTPILNCGLYYTLLGELDPGRYDERFKEFEDCVKECAKPILDELVRQTPNFEVVSVGAYYHPRYYNYETDSLEFTVKYTGNELGTVIEEYSNNQDFIDFLQNYKSYDGFISFYADNKDDFVKQDYAKSVSQIIKYNVTEEEYDEANENLYYDVMDCGFYPVDEDDTEESLKEKKYDIYVNDKYVASSDRHKRAKDVEDKIRKDGKIKYAGEKALRTSGVELDELNVGAKDKLKVKRARESKKLKEGTNTSDWDLMRKARNFTQEEVLNALKGVVSTKAYNDIKNDYKIAKLRDLTKSEQDKFLKKLEKKDIKESLKEDVSGKAKEFIEDLKEFKQFQIDRIKEYNGYDYDDIDIDFGGQDYEGCVDELIDIAQFYDGEFDNLTHTIVGKIQDCVKEKMSIFEIVDYLISDCKSEFDESLKESDDKEVEKLDTFDDQMDFLAKDEQEAIDGYKKVINKVSNAKVKSQLKKIETEEKAHKDYLNKVKKNKDLEYTEPLIERKGNKCCKGKCKNANESLEQYFYARVLKKLAGRTITEHDLDACAKEIGMNGYRLWNVLKALVDDMYITNGEKYGEEYFKIPENAYDKLPSELKENLNEPLNEYIEPYYDGTHVHDWFYKFLKDNNIKVKKATKFSDYDEYSGVAGGHTFKIYSFKPTGVINSRPEGFISSIEIDGVKIPQSVSSDRGYKELWDETFFSVEDVVELCNNNLDIDKIYLGGGCWKDEWKKLLEPLRIDFDENLKEGGSVDDFLKPMILSDTLERQPFISFAYEDQDGSTVVTTSWETTPRRAHSDYIKTRKFLGDKYNIDVLRQENRDGNKEFAYVMRITHKGK